LSNTIAYASGITAAATTAAHRTPMRMAIPIVIEIPPLGSLTSSMLDRGSKTSVGSL